MNLFFDTSALIKFFHEENGSDIVTKWVNNPANEIWLLDLAKLEFSCALYRRFRNAEITEDGLHIALEAFSEQLSIFNVEPLGQAVKNEAELLLDQQGKHQGLRTLDALHLGAFLLISEKNWAFVAADRNLCDVAKSIGCHVKNPLDIQSN